MITDLIIKHWHVNLYISFGDKITMQKKTKNVKTTILHTPNFY